MRTTLQAIPMAEQAAAAAREAARQAGVTIRELRDLDDLVEAGKLFDEVWHSADGTPILPSNLSRAAVHAGTYFAAAFDGDRMVGAAFGFPGMRGGLHLHSHLLASRGPAERSGIGFALKQHQRGWALAHGLDQVLWTFDPLVRRNAYFNLSKLGAEVADYYVDFYGRMSDGVNAGDDSDRVLIRWRLSSERVAAASRRSLEGPDVDGLRAAGAAVILDEGPSGAPLLSETSADVLLCRVPADAVALRRADPGLARSWRKALRHSMGRALGDGYAATGMSRSGWYVLERKPGR